MTLGEKLSKLRKEKYKLKSNLFSATILFLEDIVCIQYLSYSGGIYEYFKC